MGKDSGVKLSFVSSDGAEDGPINVYVHGYFNGAQGNRLKINESIYDADPPGDSYLLEWDSGTLIGAIVKGAIHSVPLILIPGGKEGKVIIKTVKFAARSNAGRAIVGGHYRGKKGMARAIGDQFADIIDNIPDVSDHPVNLVGHSLGALALFTALTASEELNTHFDINDVVFMGGVVESLEAEAKMSFLLDQIQGRLYNVYSESDFVLRGPSIFASQIGRNPIKHKSAQIANWNCQGTGHTDYWKKLDEIMEGTIFPLSPSL